MKKLFILLLSLFCVGNTWAQQPLTNTAFKAGENLSYKLYFNWQFIWITVGTAQLITTEKSYNGTPQYCCSLITRGNKRADKFFVMRDTLLCHTTQDLVPMYYRKGAKEGKRYYVDEFFYKYGDGMTHLTQKILTSSGEHLTKYKKSKVNIYDMLSIFMRARSFSNNGWEKGHTVSFPLATGEVAETAWLRYNGMSVIKAEDGHRYHCLELSYLERSGKKKKEIVRFYVTDDKNHIPIRLDLNLNFGTAKAYLTSMKGIRNPVEALVK